MKFKPMKRVEVTPKQFGEIKDLGRRCHTFTGPNVSTFDEKTWVSGIKEILGYELPLYERYVLKVVYNRAPVRRV